MFGGTNQATLLLQLILIQSLDQIASAILSRNKTITASSTYPTRVPERAIDGDHRRDADICGCCAGTWPQFEPWYQLDLGKHYTIHRIHVEGIDNYMARSFQGMQIYRKSVHANFTMGEETRITEAIQNVDFVLPTPKSTRYVSLVFHNVTRPFVICELTVYGECADGEFGDYCEHTCHCDGDPCNKTTGVCPSARCLPGYEGKVCNEVCSDGTFGSGCTGSCGNCFGNAVCNKQDGKCPGQCASGYQGDTCKQPCTAWFYGENCNKECGHCVNGEPCDPMTGVCGNGCTAGYLTSLCNTECKHGRYGSGCYLTCGNCRGNDICLFTDGTCRNGCAAGYHGDDCKAECITGTYGEGCTMRCGVCAKWTACNKTNGVCLACEPGFFGTECKSTEKMEDFGLNEYLLLIISGWIFGGVTLLAAVGIIICIKIRSRRTNQNLPQNDTSLYDIPTNSPDDEEHQYEIPCGNA